MTQRRTEDIRKFTTGILEPKLATSWNRTMELWNQSVHTYEHGVYSVFDIVLNMQFKPLEPHLRLEHVSPEFRLIVL